MQIVQQRRNTGPRRTMSQQEHENWIASEFIRDWPHYPNDGRKVLGKLAGSQYQYEITVTSIADEWKWVLFPKKITFGPIYGATPQDCLDQLKAAGIE
jgi:hypothetical protein